MKIQKDKMQHFCVNLVNSYLVSVIIFTCSKDLECSLLSGFFFSSGLSIGKEYGDKNAEGNHWCWLDLLADYAGNIVGLLFFLLTTLLWQI